MTPIGFLDIGFSEMLVVAFVALLLFGGRLPEVMRTLGTSYRKFRRGMDDVTRQVTRPDLGLDLKKLTEPYRPIPPASTKPPPGVVAPPAAPAGAKAPDAPTMVASAPGVLTPEAPRAPSVAPTPPPAAPPPPPSVRVEDDTPHV